ncbi:MAG: hypothetical protein OMM_05534 [Candidatus Magnetoglobus multicellularis str. Araruama]|uniref:Uncharacterized protein n=1 Tax=Candidatus Magnetoglobus multicellularis str. Araruama TaxID=890399 RepID=A0A1V1NVQ6_9BACT|nr:MAG: hypothetical protein OMM_05534 [Candidatus Magnetoglobus multicellularis str. Araruama]
MFKFFPPSDKMETCETWFQRNHCQFKKNNKDKQVKIVYVNRLSTWNILEKSLLKPKETIPLTPVFLGLWLYESSTKHAIGSYFDAQRQWLNTQGEDLEKTSESLTKSINSIQTPLNNLVNKLNIIGMGLLIIAGIAIIFYVIMQILMMRSKGRVIPKKADELIEDPVHPDESPLEKTGIYILEQFNEQLETVVKTAEQRIIEQMETSHQPF